MAGVLWRLRYDKSYKYGTGADCELQLMEEIRHVQGGDIGAGSHPELAQVVNQLVVGRDRGLVTDSAA